MAAPAVTGIIALMLEQFHITTGINIDKNPPKPSMFKAILVQTASDLIHTKADAYDWNNPDTGSAVLYYKGPDYATGYGMVNAQAAVSLIREKNYIADSINKKSEVDTYSFYVPRDSKTVQSPCPGTMKPTPARSAKKRMQN